MRLSIWDGVDAHRLLNGINRLRKVVYAMSKEKREAVNAVKTELVERMDNIP